MRALAQGAEQGAQIEAAVRAGVDLLLCAADRDAQGRIERALVAAVDARPVRPRRARRLAPPGSTRSAPGSRAAGPQPGLDVVGSAEHRALSRELAERSITLARGPLRRPRAGRRASLPSCPSRPTSPRPTRRRRSRPVSAGRSGRGSRRSRRSWSGWRRPTPRSPGSGRATGVRCRRRRDDRRDPPAGAGRPRPGRRRRRPRGRSRSRCGRPGTWRATRPASRPSAPTRSCPTRSRRWPACSSARDRLPGGCRSPFRVSSRDPPRRDRRAARGRRAAARRPVRADRRDRRLAARAPAPARRHRRPRHLATTPRSTPSTCSGVRNRLSVGLGHAVDRVALRRRARTSATRS